MKILFLTNSHYGEDLFDWLDAQNDSDDVIRLSDSIGKSVIKKLAVDLIISYGYKHIIKSDVLEMHVPIINLHISYLPLNRGADPLFWSLLENSIHGVTIHKIDEGVDTGPILYQEIYKIEDESETLTSIYKQSQKQIQELFKKNWIFIRNGKYELKPQECELKPTKHYIKDLQAIKDVVLGEQGWDITVRELRQRYEYFFGIKK